MEISKVKHKRIIEAGRAPTAGQLDEGELCLQLADGEIYSKNEKGEIVSFGGSRGSAGARNGLGGCVYHTTSLPIFMTLQGSAYATKAVGGSTTDQHLPTYSIMSRQVGNYSGSTTTERLLDVQGAGLLTHLTGPRALNSYSSDSTEFVVTVDGDTVYRFKGQNKDAYRVHWGVVEGYKYDSQNRIIETIDGVLCGMPPIKALALGAGIFYKKSCLVEMVIRGTDSRLYADSTSRQMSAIYLRGAY